MPIWQNSDGLTVKLGVVEGQAGVAGQYQSNQAGVHVTAFAINLATLGTSPSILDYNATLPKGALIEKVEVETTTAVTGTSAALNIGLIRTDTTTTYDVDAIGKAAALTQTAMAAVGTILTYVKGTSNAGDFVGTVLANNGLFIADYDTAAFTDGRVTVRVYWSVPL